MIAKICFILLTSMQGSVLVNVSTIATVQERYCAAVDRTAVFTTNDDEYVCVRESVTEIQKEIQSCPTRR